MNGCTKKGMSSRYIVWRLCDGYSNASAFEAHGHEDAAVQAHASDFEYDDSETFCVQHEQDGATDRKVRVIRVGREMVPDYRPDEIEKADLRARCTQCRLRFIDTDDPGYRGKCHGCNVRHDAAQIEEWQRARAGQ